MYILLFIRAIYIVTIISTHIQQSLIILKKNLHFWEIMN
jgi:hypothetical protein